MKKVKGKDAGTLCGGRKVYRSKVDTWLVLFVTAVSVGAFAPSLSVGVAWWDVALLLVLLALELVVLFGVRYELEGCWLTVRIAFLTCERHDLRRLTSVRRTRSLLSAPAASLDRLELRFGRRSLVVSPRDRQAFTADVVRASGVSVEVEVRP